MERKKVEDLRGLLVVLFGSVFFTHLFFSTRMLYNNAVILHIDYPRFVHSAWFLGEYLLPEFGAVFGYSNLLYSGYPMIHIYPIGLFYIIWFIQLFGVGYGIALKIVLFGVMVLTGILPYCFIRGRQKSEFAGISASLWIWVGSNSLWLNLITYGMIPFLLSVDLSMIFLYYLSTIDFSKKTENYRSKKRNSLAILLAIIALINYMAIILLAVAVIGYMLIKIIEERKITTTFKHLLIFLIKLVSISLLLISFWIIPTIFIQFNYVQFNENTYVFSYANSINFMVLYLENNVYTILAILIITTFLVIKNWKNSTVGMITLTMLLGIFFGFVIPFFHISFLLGINSMRYLAYFELAAAIIIGFYVESVILKFKNLKRTLHSKSRKISTDEKNLKPIKRQILIGIMIICVLYIDLTPIPLSGMTFRYPLMGEYQYRDGELIYDDLNYTQWDKEDLDLIEWIKANTTKESRILMQCSGDDSSLTVSGGHTLSYFAQITDRYYANGHLDHFWYKFSTNSTFLDENLFGTHLTSIWAQDLEKYFVIYNIEYVIVWSEVAKTIFGSIGSPNNILDEEHIQNRYNIYRYNNASKSFVYNELKTNQSIAITDFSMEQSQISFKLSEYQKNRTIVYSLHDFPNWQVYINSQKISKIDHELGLISFKIPQTYNSTILIEIIWETSTIEIVSNILSIITFLGFIFFQPGINYYKKKKQNQEKSELIGNRETQEEDQL
jgi:hypothetical protein